MAENPCLLFSKSNPLVINAPVNEHFIFKLNYLSIAIAIIIGLMIGLLFYILIYMYFKAKADKKREKWRLISNLLIRNAVFYSEEEMADGKTIPIAGQTLNLVKNKHFRNLLVSSMLSTRKNISGEGGENLKKLYLQLHLDEYALKDLKNGSWPAKAKAIQELTIMNIKERVVLVYPFTNDKHEMVRMEAQIAMVQFYGFEGLRFLDIIEYPISYWQQIKLLQQLSGLPPGHVYLNDWLKSPNESVIVFALKLARIYQRFDLYENIILCVDHPDTRIRFEAIKCNATIHNRETSGHLAERFINENFKNQLEIIKTIQSIGTDRDAMFLMGLLGSDNYEMKFNTAKALAHCGSTGMAFLEDHAKMTGFPLNEMLIQIKSEMAAA